METTQFLSNSEIYFPNLQSPKKTHLTSISYNKSLQISHCKSSTNSISLKPHFSLSTVAAAAEAAIPTMSDIMEASRRQKLDLQLQKFGPFFRISAKNLETDKELGRAEGLIRIWLGGHILHLDSIRLRRDSLGMEKSIFGIGLFIGAVAIRYGYDCGCKKAELLAINDTDLYHSKLVKFYTRIGFKAMHEVSGSSIGDVAHMLVWGGVGTRMDANIHHLLIKWCTRFSSHK